MRSTREKIRYGLLIDVGSGSVGFSIVASSNKKKQPEIIWEKREYTRVKQIESITESSKALITILTDVAMSVPGEGIKHLRETTGSAKAAISEIQVTVAAPWSYSVSRKITYEQQDEFEVTNELIHDLAVAAGEEAMLHFRETYVNVLQEVTETSRCVLDAYANGYRLPNINEQKTTNLALTHTTTLVYGTLYNALIELNEKLFADVPLHVTSSMLSFYHATRQLKPHVYDVCLVDITDEATEIGIVRDGSLTYCTHTPFGTLALARELSAETNKPLSEVVTRISELFNETSQATAKILLKAYQEKIIELFRETGDALSIPRTVYLLAEQPVLETLQPTIKQAATKASKTTTTILTVPEIMNNTDEKIQDYSLATAARFFHTTQNLRHFEYL